MIEARDLGFLVPAYRRMIRGVYRELLRCTQSESKRSELAQHVGNRYGFSQIEADLRVHDYSFDNVKRYSGGRLAAQVKTQGLERPPSESQRIPRQDHRAELLGDVVRALPSGNAHVG